MYKQAPKSPAMKALVGNQKNLPQALKAQIEASPAKNMNKGYGSPAKQTRKTSQEKSDNYDAKYTAKAAMDKYRKENRGASSSMPIEQRQRITQDLKDARTSELRTGRIKKATEELTSPAKQVTKGSVTQASQLDKSRRVDAGTVIRKKDYDLSTKEGQQSFKDDSTASRASRRANNQKALASVKAANATGDSKTKKTAQATKKANKTAEGKQVVTDAKKVSKTDKKKDVEPTTFVIRKNGVRVKKSTAQVQSRKTGEGAKKVEDQTAKAAIVRGKKGDIDFLGSGSPAQMKSPAKVKDNLTGSKVKGYAKSNLKVDKVRDKQERKETKTKKVATAKSDGKVTRLEKKGIKTSQAKLKNKQVAERNNNFQDQKVKDKKHKESTRIRNKSKKLNDAVAVGMDKNEARKKMSKALAKADKRVEKTTKRAERRKF
jgi:hypothetical protein